MTAAFVLGINMVVAGIFAVAFGAVATTNRTARGAGWVAAGYAMGIVDVALEFVLRWQVDPLAPAIGIFLAYLAALTACLRGVASQYGVAPPWKAMAAIWLASLVAIPVIFAPPFDWAVQALLYQGPYTAMQGLMGWVVFRSARRQRLDLLLVGLNVVAALSYLSKPLIAWMVGGAPSHEGYMTTVYAAISQSIGSVTLVAVALVLLLVMMRDTTAEMEARSQTDVLSGVLNRRGFDVHAERLLADARRTGGPLTLVTADLDHFKAINDGYGHAVGDEVIALFAALLQRSVAGEAAVGRLGGEEFAVLLAGADLGAARLYAEEVREALSTHALSRLGLDRAVTASFGVAQMVPEDGLSELSRRADAALYRAKGSGRNRVNLALGELPAAPDPAATPLIPRRVPLILVPRLRRGGRL